MRHDFKQHENAIEAQQAEGNATETLLQAHRGHEERLVQFEKLFGELRDEFGEFIQKDLAKPY